VRSIAWFVVGVGATLTAQIVLMAAARATAFDFPGDDESSGPARSLMTS
jgi:hypothetical protein